MPFSWYINKIALLIRQDRNLYCTKNWYSCRFVSHVQFPFVWFCHLSAISISLYCLHTFKCSTGGYFIQGKNYLIVFRMFFFSEICFVLCVFQSLCGYGITLFYSFRGNYTFELFHLYRIFFMLGIWRWYMYQINIETFVDSKECCVHSPVICAIILLDAHILSKLLYAR